MSLIMAPGIRENTLWCPQHQCHLWWSLAYEKMSNYVFAAMIDVQTHLTLDFETMSKACFVCDTKGKITSKERDFSWTVWTMENRSYSLLFTKLWRPFRRNLARGSKRMWNRSISCSLRYVNFISNGDNSTFLELIQMKWWRIIWKSSSTDKRLLVMFKKGLGLHCRI